MNDHKVLFDTKGQRSAVAYDKVLLSVGRKANLIEGLDTIQAAVDNRFITIDDHCQTNVPGVYAVGDVTGKMMLAHVAYRQAEVAVKPYSW